MLQCDEKSADGSACFFNGAAAAKDGEGEKIMSTKNNRINIPEAREAMDKFKMEAASDFDVPVPY